MIKHSLVMVQKTLKNYILLSITAILSFSFMFVFLVFSDSNMYNKYKEVMGSDEKILLSVNSYSLETQKNIKIVIDALDKIEDTNYYLIKYATAIDSFGNERMVCIIPNYLFGFYETVVNGVKRIDINGDYEISLTSGQSLVSDIEYNRIPNHKISFYFDGFDKLYTLEVAGQYASVEVNTENAVEPIYVAGNTFESNAYSVNNIDLVICTKYPGMVGKLLIDNNLSILDNYTQKIEAIKDQNVIIRNKYIIAIVLYILLGINLYSSFTSALKDRRYEIGVKRAIGASKFDIMKQFLMEGLSVMIINIMISVILGFSIVLVYKYIQIAFLNNTYVISVSKESVVLYFIFSFTLSIIFSLFFSYKGTRVEVIKFLKNEVD